MRGFVGPTLLLVALSLSPREAAARSPAASPYDYDARWQVPLTLGVSLGSVVPRLITPPRLPAPPCGRCAPRQVRLGLDRGVLGNYSPEAALVSDVLLISLVSGTLTVGVLDAAFSTDRRDADQWPRDLGHCPAALGFVTFGTLDVR